MTKSVKSKSRKNRTTATEHYTSAEYRPYVMAIGQVALAWNDLNEVLGSLFVALVGVGEDFKLQAAWQSLVSDRSKREMLRAAINELDERELRRNPKAKEEMKWLLGQIDRLETERNHVIHAPLMSFSHPIWRMPGFLAQRPEGIGPDDVRGNRLAKELRKKRDLLAEYRFIRDETIILRDYIEAIEDAWNWSDSKQSQWPGRPQLPNRGQKNAKKPRRSTSAKQLLLVPRSPQE